MVGPSFPLVFHIPLVFSAGEPKEGFAGGTHTPIYQIYNVVSDLSDWLDRSRCDKAMSDDKAIKRQIEFTTRGKIPSSPI